MTDSSDEGGMSSGFDTESGPENDTGATLPPVPSCMEDGLCVPPAPAGWSGPVALAAWDIAGASHVCPAGWPTATEGDLGLIAPDANCGCDCTKNDGQCSVDVDYYRDEACSSFAVGVDDVGDCSLLGYLGAQLALRATATPSGHGCAPNPTREIPPASWDQHALACTPQPLGECDEGICMPGPPSEFGERYCIMATGDQPCPAGSYALRTLIYHGIADNRDCSPCECGMTEPICGGTIREYEDYSFSVCTSQAGDVPADGNCRPTNVGSETEWGIGYEAAAPAFNCMPGDSTPTGEADGSNPITFCCNG